MAAKYKEVADDLRRRIARGEWAIGDRIPTIAQLMDEYGVRGLNTIRAAQQVLVEEDVLETTAGVGAFVTRVPELNPERDAVVAELANIRDAVSRALDVTARARWAFPEAVPAAPTKSWGYMVSWGCKTCGVSVGGATRGWVDEHAVGLEDGLDASLGHDGHDLVSYYGPDGAADQDEAWLQERWWERQAYEREATDLLVAGRAEEAAGYALQARQITDHEPELDLLRISVSRHPDGTV